MHHYTHTGYTRRLALAKIMRRAYWLRRFLGLSLSRSLRVSWLVQRRGIAALVWAWTI